MLIGSLIYDRMTIVEIVKHLATAFLQINVFVQVSAAGGGCGLAILVIYG